MKIRAVISGSLLLERQLRYLRTLRFGRLGTARSLLLDRIQQRKAQPMPPSESKPSQPIIVEHTCAESCAPPPRPIETGSGQPIDRDWPSDWKDTETETRVDRGGPPRVPLDVGRIIDVWW